MTLALGRLEKEFFRRVRRGDVMTREAMIDFWKRREKRLPLPDLETLREMRYRFKSSAVHARYNKPPAFASDSFHHFGAVSIDYAQMSGLAGANYKRKGFIVGCEVTTQRLAACAVTGKATRHWEKALSQFLTQDYPHAYAFLSDRESALTSRRFQQRMKERFGVQFFFLRGRHKSFHSERAIRTVKTALGVAMKANNTKKWSDYLATVVQDYNAKKVPGTTFRRSEVNRDNFQSFLAQLTKTNDPASLWNVTTLDDDSLSPRARQVIWKYQKGDLCYLSIKADYTLKTKAELKVKTFPKFSLTGPYWKVYKVLDRKLKASGKYLLTPCYVLADVETGRRLHGIFYQTELRPVLKPQTTL